MSQLVEIHYTMRGVVVAEVPDDFVLKRIDQEFIAKELGLKREQYHSIDFRIKE